MRLTMVGTGYVGLVAGAGFSDFGNDVTCADVDAGKIARLSRGEIPIYEPGLDVLIGKNEKDGRIKFTKNFEASASILNVFDRLPPYDPASGTNFFLASIYDVRGRQYRLGLTWRM